jgi:hypothetical protein
MAPQKGLSGTKSATKVAKTSVDVTPLLIENYRID